MSDELLKQYLEFYRDLGIESLYRRKAAKQAAIVLPTLEPDNDSLEKIRSDIGD